jgi:WD40 repeat protein
MAESSPIIADNPTLSSPSTLAFKYKAFISYSHAADGMLAPSLQVALHRFAKPWNRLRAMRVFRDETSLALTPELWPSIQKALEESEYFLLMASPKAAESKWVQKEIEWWLTHRSCKTLFLLVTEGTLRWNDDIGDFDPTERTALPSNLIGKFTNEPKYVDLRWARNVDNLTLSHSRFRAAILDIAPPLIGRPKDELDGEDVRQHRRLKTVGWAFVCVILVAACVAIWKAYVADERYKVAVSRHLANEAGKHLEKQPDLALLLSVEAYRKAGTAEALQALYATLDSAGPTVLLHGRYGDGRILAFSKDNRFLASMSHGGRLRLWDLSVSPSTSVILPGHQGEVTKMVFSPDGKALASSDDKGTVLLWDFNQTPPRSRSLLGHKSYVSDLRFSSNGKLLASGSGDGVFIWNVESTTNEFTHLEVGVWGLAFSPDGKSLVSENPNQGIFMLWDLTMAPPRSSPLLGYEGTVRAYAMSPTGKLYSLSDSKGNLVLWDLTIKPPTPVYLDGYRDYVRTLAFSQDGKWLAAGDSVGTLLLWDLSVQPVRSISLPALANGIWSLAFSPDSKSLVSGPGQGLLQLWDLKATPPRAVVLEGYHLDAAIDGQVFSPDGRHLVLRSGSGTFSVWHLHEDRPVVVNLPGFQDGPKAFSNDGRMLASVNSVGTFSIWDLEGPGAVRLPLHGHRGEVEDIYFDSSGRVLAVHASDATPLVWDLNTTPPRSISLARHHGAVGTLELSSDGKLLASGDFKTVRLWDLSKSPPTSTKLHDHRVSVWRIRFSSDGRFIASSDGEDIILSDLRLKSSKLFPAVDHHGHVRDFTFSPDGQSFISAGMEGTLVFRDLAVNPPRTTFLTGHQQNEMETVTYSPDGKSFVSMDRQRDVWLWDLSEREPRPIALPSRKGYLRRPVFSPDSAKLVIGCEDNLLQLIDLTVPSSSAVSLEGISGNCSQIVFSPNSHLMASTDLSGTVILWDMKTHPTLLARLPTYRGGSRGGSWMGKLVFNPTSKVLASSNEEGLLLLWDVTVNPPKSITLSHDQRNVKALSFSPDGRFLAAGSPQGVLTLWDVNFESLSDKACRIANRNLRRTEWLEYLTEDSYRPTCKDLPIEELVNQKR